MYKRILVPVDGSETSILGVREAVKIARGGGCQLCLFHVVNELILDYSYGAQSLGMSVMDSLREVGKGILQRAEELVRKESVPVESVLVESFGGSAADSIVSQAAKWHADLIVMGTHGRRGLRRLAMGSDAENVVQESSVPVLLVRHTHQSHAPAKAVA
ncbi:MAG TPA: universal stress protein [Steroidobacteraceae bacterium]|nr:universal stress protein [Steroidobacteraceae bacterium]